MTKTELSLANIESGAFPPNATAVGYLLGEIEKLREIIKGCPTCRALYEHLGQGPRPAVTWDEVRADEPKAVQLPRHLDLDAPPISQCDVCGRKSWDEERLCEPCNMPQPNGKKCPGRLVRYQSRR